ncbi:hypothetical protein IFM89_021506 [Coptis chinensis]|uniref:Rotamase n=1 Tax=Coptis chinensis TaxID=261450 RepID=A0A835HG98_9MAGN|nr:hypothetical protein IFM89_021506 [Coptis chinensis]
MSWNYGSSGLLIVAQSDVDKTNQSYYGESKSNYLTTDGAHEGLVPLRKEGPVHDVRWSSTGSEFLCCLWVWNCVSEDDELFEFKMDEVIDELDRAVMTMKKGEVVESTIALEYGFCGRGRGIRRR